MPDASKLTFPQQTVILIVSVALSSWSSTLGLRSDVRDILTRQEWAAKLQDKRDSQVNLQLEALGKQQEMQRLKIEAITLTLAERGFKFPRG